MCNILTIKGLIERFHQIKHDNPNFTGRDAYNQLYLEHLERYGIEPRYSTYASFRQNMSAFYKKRKKQQV